MSGFLGIRPVTPGQLLVIPNGQEVFHAHLHVIPRFHGDGFEIDAAAWRDPAPARERLDEMASTMRAWLPTDVGEE